MTEAEPPRRIDFVLQGARSYVRATDVLAKMMELYPGQALSLKFTRPLAGSAWLERPAGSGASVSGKAGDQTFSLRPAEGDVVQRAPDAPVPALRLLLKSSGMLAFRPGTPLPDRLAAIFDHMRPRREERMIVRQIRLFAGPSRRSLAFWFAARIAPDRRRATVVLNTPFGRLAEIDVLVLGDTP